MGNHVCRLPRRNFRGNAPLFYGWLLKRTMVENKHTWNHPLESIAGCLLQGSLSKSLPLKQAPNGYPHRARSSSREVVLFFVVYFGRGTLPTKKGVRKLARWDTGF